MSRIPPELEAEMTPAVKAAYLTLLEQVERLIKQVQSLTDQIQKRTPRNSSLPPSTSDLIRQVGWKSGSLKDSKEEVLFLAR